MQSLGKCESPQTKEGSTVLNPCPLFPIEWSKSTTEMLKMKKNIRPWLLKFQVYLGGQNQRFQSTGDYEVREDNRPPRSLSQESLTLQLNICSQRVNWEAEHES